MLWSPEKDLDDSAEEDVLLPNGVKTAEPKVEPKKEENKFSAKPAAVAAEKPAFGAAAAAAQNLPKQECLLSNGSKFVGNIDTSDNVVLAGHLEGNLTSSGTVRITGTIKGDVSAECVDLIGGSVEGNIIAVDTLNVDKGGKVLGNLEAGAINLKAGTSVNGDVKGGTVFMESGAGLHGKLDIGE